ncbi:hypothetical protein PHYSODRAFT_343169 [Phytophthora sojae]|uniref:Cytochrome P450 n=1 Tax=Phytophthora sojae (strain P6497) TaxID=1094619 RepID=G5AIU9_PHYSP|nr:hypothetical protein PHYSODRAFT_343169 [Phytophthora sojae]EGZ04562.1 hypothetical protein PHYSODRAFT_343169 [Phytophthora sojae]|eukprot:XP_009540000.1 hypothetical protein PHYSODRAFT_343169 [Phytophthora sojae]
MLAFLPTLAASDSRQNVVTSALIALLLGASTYATLSHIERSRAKHQPHKEGLSVPRPSTTLPIMGNTLDFVKNNDVFHDCVSSLVQEFNGEPFLLSAPGRPDILVVWTPEAFEGVAKRQFDTFVKGDVRALRESITSTIQKHDRTLHTLFENAAVSGESFDLFRLLSRFAMESFAEIGFGIQMGSLAIGEDHPFEKAFDITEEATAKRFSETGYFPTMDEVQSLTYIEAAIKETLRLYPPASTAARTPSSPTYKPERFLDPGTGKLLSVSAFKFPAFFAGPRICVGMNLAMLEMKIVLTGRVTVQPGQEVTYVRSLALLMNPFMVKIEKVSPSVVPIA